MARLYSNVLDNQLSLDINLLERLEKSSKIESDDISVCSFSTTSNSISTVKMNDDQDKGHLKTHSHSDKIDFKEEERNNELDFCVLRK